MSSPKHAGPRDEISMLLQSSPHHHDPQPGSGGSGGPGRGSGEHDTFMEQPLSHPGKSEQARISHGCLLKTFAILVFILVAMAIGFIIGFFTHRGLSTTPTAAMTTEDRRLMHQQAVEGVSHSKLEAFERLHTSQQCIMGNTQCTGNLTQTIVEQLSSMGFKVSVSEYKVLASYPNMTRQSMLRAVDAQGRAIHSVDLYGGQDRPNGVIRYQPQANERNASVGLSENQLLGSSGDSVVDKEANAQPAMPVYMPYSASGMAQGDLVYVNYGRQEDFSFIANAGVNVSGKIALVRQGRGSAFDQATIAASHGIAGLLLYPDPSDMTSDMSMTSVMTPDLTGMVGDPLTPGCPSMDGIYRSPMDSISIPTIPVQPVSMATATMLLSNLTGIPAEGPWVGGLDVSYRIGLPDEETQPWSVELEIHNDMIQTSIFDVVATIEGSENPDQYVLLGGQYSNMMTAMVTLGSLSAVMESARVIGGMVDDGWTPRRTIMIGLWEGSEFGHSGSTEWAEENHMVLKDRAVAYIDLGGGGGGTILNAQTSPMLQGVIMGAADQLGLASMVNLDALSGAGDHVPFSHMIGIPSANIEIISSQDIDSDVFPTASGMVMLMSSTQLSTQVVLSLADDEVLGLDARAMADTVMTYVDNLDAVIGGMMTASDSMHMTMLRSAADDFMSAVQGLQGMIGTDDIIDSPVTMTMVNSRLMYMERSFIDSGSSGTLGSVLYGMQATETFSTISSMMTMGNITMATVEQTLSRLQCTVQSASRALAMSPS